MGSSSRAAPRTRRVCWSALAGVTIAGTVIGMLPASAAGGPLPDEASIDQIVGAQTAWQSGATGQGVDVALIDTGVTPVPGLTGSNKLLYGPDLSFDSQNPSMQYVDGYGHGTAMAGIIAGNDGTDGGYKGVAPDARIVSVKVGASTGASDVSQMIAGIDWVTQHAHDPGMNIRVINLSLGTNSMQNYQIDPLAHAAEVAWRHGIVVVVSTGNDGSATNTVADPAIDPYLLAVGADDPQGTVATSDDTVASFSQRGTGTRHADLVAPGTYVYGLLSPNSTLAQQNPNAVFGGRFLRGSGTSQAAAVTSGVVADLLSARPNLSPDQVKGILTSTASRISTNNPNFVGSGLVNLPAALTAPTQSYYTQTWYPSNGSGLLEAARGTSHVSLNGVPLTGEQDIFGQPWGPQMPAAEELGSTWSGGIYNGSTWSGSTWSGSTWSSCAWQGATWNGATWN